MKSSSRLDSEVRPTGVGCGSVGNNSLDAASVVLYSLEEPVTEGPETTTKYSEITSDTLLPVSHVLVLPIEKPITESQDSTFQSSKITNGSLSSGLDPPMEESITESTCSTSQYSDVTNGSLSPLLIPPMEEPVTGSLESTSQYPKDTLLPMTRMLAPHIQVMKKHRQGSDTDSIPDSVFSGSSMPSATSGWSAASNDSLFSIRMGNHSFSTDHTQRIDFNLCKPEKPKSGDPQEPYSSLEYYQPRENFKAIDQTIPVDAIMLRQATSSMSQGEEPMYSGETSGLVCHSLNHTSAPLTNNQADMSSKLSSDSSRPTLHSDKGRTKTQKSTHQRKKSFPLPCHCPDLCQFPCGKRSCWSCKCFSWPSCTCFKCNNCCWCSMGSAWSCKWLTWPKWLTWRSCANCSIWKCCLCNRSSSFCKCFTI